MLFKNLKTFFIDLLILLGILKGKTKQRLVTSKYSIQQRFMMNEYKNIKKMNSVTLKVIKSHKDYEYPNLFRQYYNLFITVFLLSYQIFYFVCLLIQVFELEEPLQLQYDKLVLLYSQYKEIYKIYKDIYELYEDI